MLRTGTDVRPPFEPCGSPLACTPGATLGYPKVARNLEQVAENGAKDLQERRLRLLGVVLAAGALLGCRGSGPSGPALRADERALVEVYVRIAQIESMRSDQPDSVGPAFDRLAATYDSTAVERALAELEAEPTRWQFVFDAIAQRLHQIEESTGAERLPGAVPRPDVSAPEPARSPSKPRIP